jgi:hypothetical protein
MNRREFLGGSIALPLAAFEPRWDLNGQQERRQTINGLHAKACASLFSADGDWIGPATEGTGRVRFWHSMSLLESEATREQANAIIRKCFEDRGKLQSSFSHFEFCSAAQLLTKQKDKIAPGNRQALANLLREALEHQSPIYFRGYNDNYPAMENLAAVLGGEELDDVRARQRGLEGLRHLLELFERRGLLSEYTSSTYTPVTQLCYADIAEYSGDSEAKRLALQIENRIWFDIAAHFHAPTNILAGPHSRAYNVDSVGHLHQVHMLLYQCFGDRLWLNPVHFLFPPAAKQVIHHDGDLAFMQASNVWMASGTYHPSAETARLMFGKTFPFRVSATSEFGAAELAVLTRVDGKFQQTQEILEYPCGELVSTSYLTEDYAIGSATSQFHDGNQTDTFFVNFKRSEKPSSLKDTGTIFCRYACNGDGPGLTWHDPRNQTDERSRDLFADAGRVHTVQKNSTVLTLYQSKAQFIDDYSVLRLVLVVPVFYRKLRRLMIGDGMELSSKNPEIVWIEDDFLYAAFRPLIPTDHGRRFAVTADQNGDYLAISFYNYDGPPSRFSRKELLRTLNGFVAEIGSRREYGSFDRFRSHVLEGRVEDVVADGQRITRYNRPGIQLDLCHSLYFGGVKYALVDGKLQPRLLLEGTKVSGSSPSPSTVAQQ